MQLPQKQMNIQWFVYIVIAITSIKTASAQYNISNFLESTSKSSIIVNDSTSLAQLEDVNYNLPFFNGVELRTETRDLLLKRQEYAIRFKPNSISAITKQKNVYNSKLEEARLNTKLNFNKELKTRYQIIIDYVFIKKELLLQQKRKKQLEDALLIYQESIYETNFNVKDLIETEEELLETNIHISTLEDQLVTYKNIIQQLSGSNTKIEVIAIDDLITPQQIINSPIEIVNTNESLKISLKKLKLQTLDNEIQLDVAKSRQLIDFVQAKYGGKRSVLFDENFSIGLGINLPFFGKNKKKKGDYYFEKLNEESELFILKQEDKTIKQEATQQFKTAVNNYNIQYQQTQESSTKSLLKTYKGIEGVSPATLIKLEILLLKKNINALKSQKTLYKAYIELLAVYQIAYKEPYINYLSSTLQTLSF